MPGNLDFVDTLNDKNFREKLKEKINSEQLNTEELFYQTNQNKNHLGFSNEDYIILFVKKYLKKIIDDNNIKLKEKDITIPPINRELFKAFNEINPITETKLDIMNSFSKDVVLQIVGRIYNEIEDLKFLLINLSQSAESQNFYNYNEIKIFSKSTNKSLIPLIFSLFFLILGMMIIFYQNIMEKNK